MKFITLKKTQREISKLSKNNMSINCFFDNNILLIEDKTNNLSPPNISQLLFWGFKKNKNVFKSNPIYDDDSLRKYINYIKDYSTNFCFDNNIREILEKHSVQFQSVKDTLELGQKFKDGDINQKEFNDFVEFTKKNIKRSLKDHQLKAAMHLTLVGYGANFSVPGSGKSTVILTHYKKLILDDKVDVLFVVGPTSSFGPWRNEFYETFGEQPNYHILAGGDKNSRKEFYYKPKENIPELILTSYHTLYNDQEQIIALFKRFNSKIYLIFDEAHNIKQLNGNWSNAAILISQFANYRCVLTGTPFPKSYKDVFNLVDILWQNLSPLDPITKVKISVYEEQNNFVDAKELIYKKISPLFYRVRKSELNLKPQIFHEPIQINMNKYEKLIYEGIVTRISRFSKEDYLKNIDLINRLARGRIMRLRQCASYIGLLKYSLEDYHEELIEKESNLYEIIYKYDELESPAKLEYLLNLIKGIGLENKFLIWSNFVHTIEFIHSYLEKNNIASKFIYGDTPIEKEADSKSLTREEIISEFLSDNSEFKVLIANPAACSESISLHKSCHFAIYYDLSYNCAQYLQSLDRIHRVGGSELIEAHYYFLQYENTVDVDILRNLNDKARRMYEIIEEDCPIYNLDMFNEGDDNYSAYNRIFKS